MVVKLSQILIGGAGQIRRGDIVAASHIDVGSRKQLEQGGTGRIDRHRNQTTIVVREYACLLSRGGHRGNGEQTRNLARALVIPEEESLVFADRATGRSPELIQ